MRFGVAVVTIALAAVNSAAAQPASVAEPTFDVASIKPNDSASEAGSFQWRPDGLTIGNYSLSRLLQNAYGLEEFRLEGGPDWLDRDRFDVNAKASDAVSRDILLQMLQGLLRERFRLAVRREVRSAPIFNLVVARAGQLGPRLTRSSVDCRVSPAECKMNYTFDSMTIHGQPLSMLAHYLTSAVRRTVLDRTELVGPFNFSLQYNRGDKPDSPHPSLFRALEEQLGLKLESGTGPVEFLVIERAGALIPD